MIQSLPLQPHFTIKQVNVTGCLKVQLRGKYVQIFPTSSSEHVSRSGDRVPGPLPEMWGHHRHHRAPGSMHTPGKNGIPTWSICRRWLCNSVLRCAKNSKSAGQNGHFLLLSSCACHSDLLSPFWEQNGGMATRGTMATRWVGTNLQIYLDLMEVFPKAGVGLLSQALITRVFTNCFWTNRLGLEPQPS